MCGSQKKRLAWGNKRGQNRTWNSYEARRRSEREKHIFCGRLVRKVVVFRDPKCSGHRHFVSFIIRDFWLGSTFEREHTHYPGIPRRCGSKEPYLLASSVMSLVAPPDSLYSLTTFGPKYCSAQFRLRLCRDTQKLAFFFAPPRHYFFLEAEL